MPRKDRASDQLRAVTLQPDFTEHAEGSVLVSFGRTRVLCTASAEERVPSHVKGSGRGWITAEYGMLPRATHTRSDREAAKGKQTGRTQEIQRLIGRSLRAAVDLPAMGERQIIVDCDVLQADGGTRTASITGSYVALGICLRRMQRDRRADVHGRRAGFFERGVEAGPTRNAVGRGLYRVAGNYSR